jgi:hypothetical protein
VTTPSRTVTSGTAARTDAPPAAHASTAALHVNINWRMVMISSCPFACHKNTSPAAIVGGAREADWDFFLQRGGDASE